MTQAQTQNGKIQMTKEGYEKLKEELVSLRTEGRSEIARKLEEARSFGDLSENAEYHAAKEEQAQMETRIQWLESRLSRVDLVDTKSIDTSKVGLGATVTIRDLGNAREYTYTIVGSDETDPKQSRISQASPVGQALQGKSIGDVAQVKVPKGIRELKILDIRAN
ncbi:MAG: transcription elongation factor GreA [Synergistales bacterium]|nr:transcription elongation factor GreA [Synergistales bacterium]